MDKIDIVNKALRLLGQARITEDNLTAEDTESARIMNDIYDSVLDETLSSHPWNFAKKRAELTEIGGLITTWTAEGTANVWQATLDLDAAPSMVKFNGTEGTEKTSVATLTAANYWYWASDVLYVYSTSDPDTAYDSPGIEAVIPEFGYDHAFTLPTDCLRVIKMEDDAAKFVKEGTMLFTDESEAKIQYIAQITTTTLFSPHFIAVFAQRLAAEMTIPVTNSPEIAREAYGLYKDKQREGKAINAQEGTGEMIDESNWEDVRG